MYNTNGTVVFVINVMVDVQRFLVIQRFELNLSRRTAFCIQIGGEMYTCFRLFCVGVSVGFCLSDAAEARVDVCFKRRKLRNAEFGLEPHLAGSLYRNGKCF